MLTPHQRIVDAARRIRQPIYLVTALYVGVGFLVGGYGALSGDRLAAFLGFFFISGALCAALMFHAMARLAVRISGIGVSVEELRGAVERIERDLAARPTAQDTTHPHTDLDVQQINLADFGAGDPAPLAAATLERGRFPRLLTTMDEEAAAPLETSSLQGHSGEGSPGVLEPSLPDRPPEVGPREVAESKVSNRNLVREWKRARRLGDVATCRDVLSTLMDTADPRVVAELADQMAEVTDRAERFLRAEFSECVQRRDFLAALDVGRKIKEYFPNEPIANEVERIRPYLLRRVRPSPKSKTPLATTSPI